MELTFWFTLFFAVFGISRPIDSPRLKRKEVCFEEIGCLSLLPPWDQLWGFVPKSPSALNTRFFLRNRKLPSGMDITNGTNHVSPSSPRSSCKVIFHGFATSRNAAWVEHLGQTFIDTEDCEVITVDWSQGAAGPNYFQAVANTRTVAAVVAKFLLQLLKTGWCSKSNLHFIGQSLGAHLASYVANNLTEVAEITGLDPAQPWFENNVIETHLDPSDANFVQVVHTNILPFWPNFGLGFSKPSGHVDFYLNGGTIQPGCTNVVRNQIDDKTLAGIIEWLACSHLKAQEYYTDALKKPFSCKYTGLPWEHKERDPPSLRGKNCTISSCQQLGRLSKYLPARGSFYIYTNFTDSYCIKYGDKNNILVWLESILTNIVAFNSSN